MPKAERTKKEGGSKDKRKPSAYNQFMKDNLSKVKAKDTSLDHKAAFKKVAEMWKSAPENPKNKK